MDDCAMRPDCHAMPIECISPMTLSQGNVTSAIVVLGYRDGITATKFPRLCMKA